MPCTTGRSSPPGDAWSSLFISRGPIFGILPHAGAYAARHELDCRHLLVMPGVIDSQVHFREPGFPHKETLATGTRAALKGGVTTIFDMPNTKPPTLDEAALDEKKARAGRTAACHYAFFVGASNENASRLATLEHYPGVCGVKLFMGSSTGSLLVWESPHLERVVQSGTRRMAIHAELESRLRERRDKARRNDVASHTDCRDVSTAFMATQHILQLAERYQRPIHILHVSTAEELELIVRHKSLVSMEVTPQHLTLASPMCYRELGTLAQMNPPIPRRTAPGGSMARRAVGAGGCRRLGPRASQPGGKTTDLSRHALWHAGGPDAFAAAASSRRRRASEL